MSGLSLGTRLPNLKFEPSAVLELLAFNAQTLTGSREGDHAHFSEILSGVVWGLYLGRRLPNLKLVSSAVLQLLAFNAQKIMGSRDRDHAHFSEIFVKGHVGTIPGNMRAKFEVPTFSRFGADRQTVRQNGSIRDDLVVNGDHAHVPDIRHTTRKRF